ncbi:MAG TPA: hypothetical protein VID26_10555 [Candidatus Limnocylindrales bacterium]|jgi:hypothetical protein
MSAPRDIWAFYRLLDSIEERLAVTGNGSWATRLRDAVYGGTTSGEILDRVGVVLIDLDAIGLPDRVGIGDAVATAGRFVEAALGHPRLDRRR